jgi:hypothetical protein
MLAGVGIRRAAQPIFGKDSLLAGILLSFTRLSRINSEEPRLYEECISKEKTRPTLGRALHRSPSAQCM